MALILITHDLGVVAGRTDEIAVMYAGRVVEQAPTKALFGATRHPYTRALLRSIPRISDPSHTRLAAVPGRPPTVIDPPPGCSFAPRCPHAQSRCLEQTPVLTDDPTAGDRHRSRASTPWAPSKASPHQLPTSPSASPPPVFPSTRGA